MAQLIVAKTLEFDEGWEIVQEGLTKLDNIVAGKSDSPFNFDEYKRIYNTIYPMCTQKTPHDYSQRLCDKYKETFEEYLSSVVLPFLQEKHDHEPLLREFVKRWSNHKIMLRWKMRIFRYLDRYYTDQKALADLNKVGFICFRDLVYAKVKEKVRDAACFLIDQEREGEQIDQALLKDVVDIFVEMGSKKLDYYVNDFEATMLDQTAAYYSQKALSLWDLEYFSSDNTLKVEEYLKLEKDRVSHYLHPSTEPKLLERVRQAV